MGGMGKKRQEMYKEFKEFADSVGIWNVGTMKYSEMTGIPSQTISNWKTKYLSETKFDINKFAKEINSQGMATLKRIAILTQGKDKVVALKAGKYLLEGADKYMDILKKLGVIDTTPEEPALQIAATDKDLYNLLTAEQKKKLAKMVEKA